MQFSLKYRPVNFNKIYGHSLILQEFKKRSKNLNFPQAILFSGKPGTGKNTFAFNIAKVLNCSNPVLTTEENGYDPTKKENNNNNYNEPCNKCASCKSVLDETFNQDIKLLDSSKLNKQDLLEIEEMINISPMFSKNKIIIIDEIQELTQKHHNTLLKVLEKPRKNVYFILTTMHLEKLSKAVISRCQHYKLKESTFEDISNYLFSILIESNLLEDIEKKVEPSIINKALILLSENSGGSFRNAVQYLERCVYADLWTEELIMKEFGFLNKNKLELVLKALVTKDANFFSLIKDIDVKEFYFITFSTLLESEVYKFTNFAKYKFKEKTYKYLNSQDISKLLEIYIEINNMITYNFKDTLFMAKIIKYFNTQTRSVPPINNNQQRRVR